MSSGDRPQPIAPDGVGDAVRGEFPIFEHTIYLNSCSQGALSHRVRAAYEEYLAGWDANGAEWEFWVERAEAARAGFATLLHGEPDEVAVTTSVSQGVSGSSRRCRSSAAGATRIVISEYEFPTVGQIAHAQELRGAEVVHVRPEPRRRRSRSSGSPRRSTSSTALVCCTTISYRTGHRHDVAAIAEVAHAKGALVLADSYQAAGAIELDVRELGADFVTGGTVKYLLASAGLGFLWVRGGLIDRADADADRLVRGRGHLPDGHLRLLAARERAAVRRGHAARAEHLRRGRRAWS